MKKGTHIGIVSGNMFFQITNGGFWGVLSKNGSKTPINSLTLDMLLTTCVQPSVDSDDHIWKPALGNNTHTMGGGLCLYWPIRGQ